MPDHREAAARWARVWTEAWEARDVDAIVALYAPDVTFSSHPFRVPHSGWDGVRAYVTQAFAAEEAPRVRMSAPIVEGNRAAVSWWADLREDGADATLAGTSVLRFDDEGLVKEQWDAWDMLDDERRAPPLDGSPFST